MQLTPHVSPCTPTHTHIRTHTPSQTHSAFHWANACSKSGSFTAKPQLFFTHTLWFVCLLTNCTCSGPGCPQSCKCMTEAQLNLTALIRNSKTDVARSTWHMKWSGLPLVMLLLRMRKNPLLMLLLMTTVDECVMSITVCLLLFSKRLLFTFCDYRTPTLLSVLILTLSGRYSNECSPLDPSVNSARATYIQNFCFSLSR